MQLVSYGFIGSTHPWVDITTMFFLELYADTDYMGVSKNRGTPQWMVYNGKPY